LSKKEAGKAIALGLISTVPVVGGALSNLIEIYLPSSLKSKREKILDSLAIEMERVGEKISIDWDAEMKKEETQGLFLKFFRLTEAEVQTEKIHFLQNIFLNSIIVPIDYDKKCVFLDITSGLTVRHITVLKLMSSPSDFLKQKQAHLGSISMGGIDHLFDKAIDDYKENKDFYGIIYKDLQAKHLLQSGGWGVTMTLDGILSQRTTDFGKEYISYLENPKV
jgi:hypothetical protein